ncbi:MAG: rhodanese-like domain-containing protein [Cellvibrio sp.]|uniref:sulfurtransferase n=1 Tax=Cellvibrio sp. TaxID=1965322 RepID=UPI0031B35471
MARFPLLISGKELSAHLGEQNLIVVDVGKSTVYSQAHIPGAIHVDYRRLQKGELPVPGLAPALEDVAALLTEIGVTPETHVVAYDDEGGTRAARFLWLLDAFSHQHFSFLDGGIHAWLAEDLPYEVEPAVATSVQYPLTSLIAKPQINLDYLLNHYRDEDVQIWDARTPEEFSGERVMAQRRGHIPGAINYNWENAIDRANDDRVRNIDIIRTELNRAGISGDKKIITHCQTHHRSSFTWLLGKILGFDIIGYPGAWAEWGNHPATPVATLYQTEDLSS